MPIFVSEKSANGKDFSVIATYHRLYENGYLAFGKPSFETALSNGRVGPPRLVWTETNGAHRRDIRLAAIVKVTPK